MKKFIEYRAHLRKKRAQRVRKNIHGTAIEPRLCVNKTNVHLYAQLIDDDMGCTLGSVSTVAKEFRTSEHNRKSKESAQALGTRLAEICKELNISRVKFDRGARKYHGTLAAFADAARAGGLQF